MAMRVIYLEIDDEITSAASRIRSADEISVAVVLPNGSRVATSRINFRLLARDATLNGKRLSIIAGDDATRALAASAGLPIFSNVAEYETALEEERGERAETNGAGAAVATVATGAAPEAEPVTEAPLPAATPRSGSRRRGAKPRSTPEEAGSATAALAIPLPLPLEAPAADLGLAAPAPRATRPAAPPAPVRQHAPPAAELPPIGRAPTIVPAARVMADTPSRPANLDGPFAPLAGRMPIVIGAAILALALVVGGVGAFVLLPTATVVITPREELIGPVELRITADPSATTPDQATKVVPALTKDLEVEVNGTFEVTGKRIEETPAKGAVRFVNFDTSSSNTVPRGSLVGTRSGKRFRTDRSVTIKAATYDQSSGTFTPGSATVAITAIDAGTDGNVDRNTITLVPENENSRLLDVTNPDATSGGKRDEFPRVAQADIDKAMTTLRDQLTTKFRAEVADPALAVDGTTIFPETAVLGEATFGIDPATLLRDEVPSFELGATASGTVLAVDESAVEAVAGADIATHVQPGHTLVDGSSEVRPSPGVVEGGSITFPVVITARQVLDVDTAAIEGEIRGKSLGEVQTILQRYGTADVSVWPDWVSAIPTLDARVEVRSSAAETGSTP